MYIALEGLPGSGKTTISMDIAHEFKCKHINELLIETSQNTSEKEFILNDVMKSKITKQNDFSISDRCFISTLAYNYAHDIAFGTKEYEKIKSEIDNLIQLGKINKPDLLIVYNTAPDLSLQRQKRSNPGIWFDRNFLEQNYAYYKNKQFISYAKEIVHIDSYHSYDIVLSLTKEVIAKKRVNSYV